MKTKLGIELTAEDQQYCLSAFTNRYTYERIPLWVYAANRPYACQFASDLDWLAHTRFAVLKNGRLNRRARYCESSPTWPYNPELRKANEVVA